MAPGTALVDVERRKVGRRGARLPPAQRSKATSRGTSPIEGAGRSVSAANEERREAEDAATILGGNGAGRGDKYHPRPVPCSHVPAPFPVRLTGQNHFPSSFPVDPRSPTGPRGGQLLKQKKKL